MYIGSRPSSELKILPKLFSYPYGLGKAATAYNTLTNMPSPLPSTLDPIPVPSDERLSEPERDQLATPCSAYAEPEGPEHRSTNILKTLPDRVFFSKDILGLEKNMRTYQSLSTLMSQIGRSSPGEALPTLLGGGSLPLPPLGLRGSPVGTWGPLIIRYVCVAILPSVYYNN